MKKKSFKVEFVFNDTNAPFLFARQIGDFNFSLSENSKLGCIDIKPVVSQPRKIKENGEPDFQVYAFVPKNKCDIKSIQTGTILELHE